uniref:Uncharacterized protein AlNc14C8G1091 n=1 Tax=Albugo laibachii Nc14 TaxID=890382 RepID=F0W214_9STRA|nr:conserved hypothetical protein [Albugo laibachii Nc14]|eukprot:CCA15093.1 conserved hypothetical protein [Albugo laibachii Nc14]
MSTLQREYIFVHVTNTEHTSSLSIEAAYTGLLGFSRADPSTGKVKTVNEKSAQRQSVNPQRARFPSINLRKHSSGFQVLPVSAKSPCHSTVSAEAKEVAFTHIIEDSKHKRASKARYRTSANTIALASQIRRQMSRFSIVNVMGRNGSVETDVRGSRPSVTSLIELNKQLDDETKKRKQDELHYFFGPQLHIFDGKDRVRVMHSERRIQKNAKRVWMVSEPISMERSSTTTLEDFPEASARSTFIGGTVNTIAAASRFLGKKVAQMKTTSAYLNEDSFCDGCGMDPILGNMYTCSRCENYHLCESCYQLGVHGYEESVLLRSLREDYAMKNAMEMSRNRVPEKVFEVLMKQVCKGQVEKFNFMSAWISKVVTGQPVVDLSARGIEIPNLDYGARCILVEKLTPVLAERNDLEVCMEWFRAETDTAGSSSGTKNPETLRIWVSTDKNSKSPFLPKTENTTSDNESISGSSSMGSPHSPSMSLDTTPTVEASLSPSVTSPSDTTNQFPDTPLSHQETLESQGYSSDDGEDSGFSSASDIQTQAVAGRTSAGEPTNGIAL